MAHAICIKCGETKAKALDACPSCEFEPVSSHEKAQSMVATTHNLAEAKLTRIAGALMRGERVELPFEQVLEYMDMFEGRAEADAPVKLPSKGCAWLVFFWVLMGLAVLVLFSA
jgi:hypothetical protein